MPVEEKRLVKVKMASSGLDIKVCVGLAKEHKLDEQINLVCRMELCT